MGWKGRFCQPTQNTSSQKNRGLRQRFKQSEEETPSHTEGRELVIQSVIYTGKCPKNITEEVTH